MTEAAHNCDIGSQKLHSNHQEDAAYESISPIFTINICI